MCAMSGDLREGPASGQQPGRSEEERPAELDPVPSERNGQSSLALERARLEAEALASIARDLAGSLRTQDLLQRIVGAAAALTVSDLSHIAVSDPDDGLYRVRAVSGARTNLLLGLPQAAPNSLGALALAKGQPAWTDNRTADPRLNQGVYGFVAAEGCVSQLVAP